MGPIGRGFNWPTGGAAMPRRACFRRHAALPAAGARRALPAGTLRANLWSRPPWAAYAAREDAGLTARRGTHEEDRSGDQAVQAGRSEGGAARGRAARNHGGGSQGVRPAERPHRIVSRRRVCRRLPPQGKDRGRLRRRGGGARGGTRLAGHGADRAPFRPLLEGVQAADGLALLASLARGRRARARLDDQPLASDRGGRR